MRILMATFCGGMMLTLAACGNTVTERAATGGVGGAVVAGPVGAVAGAGLGAVTAD